MNTKWVNDWLILVLMIFSYAGAHRMPCYPSCDSPWFRSMAVAWHIALPVATFFFTGFFVALFFWMGSSDYPYFLTGPTHNLNTINSQYHDDDYT